jgi:hypothetical protein
MHGEKVKILYFYLLFVLTKTVNVETVNSSDLTEHSINNSIKSQPKAISTRFNQSQKPKGLGAPPVPQLPKWHCLTATDHSWTDRTVLQDVTRTSPDAVCSFQ